MTQKSREDAIAWLRTVVDKHVAANARRYKFCTYTGAPNVNSTWGFQVDLSPQEGKVAEVTDDWVLVKTGRSDFFVCARELMESVPAEGDKVLITPYARKQWGGRRLDAPEESVAESGVRIQTFKLGESRSYLPIDKASLQCPFLLDMINQVEVLSAPDGVRKLAQVLIDAGASQGPVSFKDPAEADVIAIPPTLQFRVNTQKYVGWINLVYDRAMDYYRVELVEDGSRAIVKTVENVDFESLAGVVVDLIDDGRWRIAKVEVLKTAPKRKAA